jgi:hypothetical protein
MNTDEHGYFDALTERVLGAVFEVSNTLGAGFLEKVYQRALLHDLEAARLGAVRDHDGNFGVDAPGLDAPLDDRDERPGVKLKDADQIGVPYRTAIGKKIAPCVVELVERRGWRARWRRGGQAGPCVRGRPAGGCGRPRVRSAAPGPQRCDGFRQTSARW